MKFFKKKQENEPPETGTQRDVFKAIEFRSLLETRSSEKGNTGRFDDNIQGSNKLLLKAITLKAKSIFKIIKG